MTNRVNRTPRRELDETELQLETTSADDDELDLDPAELEEIAAIEPPNWEEMVDPYTNLGRNLSGLGHSSAPTSGDRDIDPYLAEIDGDESVGGSTAMPEQNDIDDLGDAAGIEIPDGGILHTTEMLEHRDTDRWELDPDSAK
jgi:Family of unknown function (DUF6335)